MINQLDLKAIIFGCSFVVVLWVLQVLMLNLVANNGSTPDIHLLNSIVYGARTVIVALGGYIAFRISKQAAVLHGIVVGIIASIIIVLPTILFIRYIPLSDASNTTSTLRDTAIIGLLWNIVFSCIGAKIAEAQLNKK